MPRKKRTSPALNNASNRAAGLRDISPTLDLGNGLLLSTYTQKIEALRTKLVEYNSTISQLDDLAREVRRMETELRTTSETMLLAVAVKYGKNSNEYGKAGGTLSSERKKTSKTIKATTPANTTTPVEMNATASSGSLPAIASQSISMNASEVLPFTLSTTSSNGAPNGNGKALKA